MTLEGTPRTLSVIIPTRNRPELVTRAIRSALAQTLAPHEIIVVLDGPDPATAARLAQMPNERIRLVALPGSVGGAEARNRGVQAATGELIAFLDDDDEWFPRKLELQSALYSRVADPRAVIACRLLAKSPYGEFTWPRRLYSEPENLAEYLFVRRSAFQGEALVQTSMILASKALFAAVPFNASLKCHQEWDWLLRARRSAGARLYFSPEVLATWYIEQDRASISSATDYRDSLDWIDSVADQVSKRAYAGFLLTILAPRALRSGGLRAFASVFARAVSRGAPTPRLLLLAIAMLLVPQHRRRQLRSWYHAVRRGG